MRIMDIIQEDQVTAEIRKQQNILYHSGAAAIAMTLWDMVKTMLHLYLDPSYLTGMIDDRSRQILTEKGVMIITVLTLIAIFGIALIFKSIIGLGAMKTAKGVKNGKLYLVLACINLLLGVISFVKGLIKMQFITELEDYHTVSIVLDISTIIVLVMIIRSSFLLKVLQKKENNKSDIEVA